MTTRTCILCKHFEFISGEPGYSEFTPGSDAYINCHKGVFYENLNNIYIDGYRECMLKANSCAHYKEIDVPPVANGNFQIPS